MKRQRTNRMAKREPGDVERMEPAQEPEEEPEVVTGYPCKYCQGPSEVTHTWPPFEGTQEPIKIIKRRRRRCLKCRRAFTTQEEAIKES